MTFLPLGYPDRSKQPRVYPGKIMQMYILLRYVIPVMFLFLNFFQKKKCNRYNLKNRKIEYLYSIRETARKRNPGYYLERITTSTGLESTVINGNLSCNTCKDKINPTFKTPTITPLLPY